MSQEKRQREGEEGTKEAQAAHLPPKARKDERKSPPPKDPREKGQVLATMVFNSRPQVDRIVGSFKSKTLSFAPQAYCWFALEKTEKAMLALGQLGLLRLTQSEAMLTFEGDKLRILCVKSRAGEAERVFDTVLTDFLKENGLVKPLEWNERTVPIMENSTDLSFPTFRAKEVSAGSLYSEKHFAGCIAVTNFPEKAGVNQLLAFGSVEALAVVLKVFPGPYTIPASNNKVATLAVLEIADVGIALELQLDNLKAKKVGLSRSKAPIYVKDCIVAVNVQRYSNTGRVVSAVVVLKGAAAAFAKKKEAIEGDPKSGAFKFNDYFVRLAKAPEVSKGKEKEPQATAAAATVDPDERYFQE